MHQFIIAATLHGFIIASAFGDAATKAIGFIDEVKLAIIAMIVVSAGCAVAFTRGHKMEILGAAALAVVLVSSFKTIASGL